MSRIQQILDKAERDGFASRTRRTTATSAAAPVELDVRATRTASPGFHAAAAEVDRVFTFDPLLTVVHAPQSHAAEQYRILRTRLDRIDRSRSIRTLVVTSPGKGDGKSLTTVNLALTLAQDVQGNVLVLDADLRRPRVHALLGVSPAPGLSDVLTGRASLDDVIVTIPGQRLSVLPAGIATAHPAELLGSQAMRRVLDSLAGRYSRILIDTPPVAPLSDVGVLSPLVDGVLLVVRAGVTPKPAIDRALGQLDAAKVLGLVLNDVGDGQAPAGYYGADYGA